MIKYLPFLLLLSGCTTIEYQKEYLTLSNELLQKCPEIQEIGKGEVPLGDLLKYTLALMGQYNECAVRMDKVIEANEKLKNTK